MDDVATLEWRALAERKELIRQCNSIVTSETERFRYELCGLLEEALAVAQIEESAGRQALEEERDLLFTRAARFHLVKTLSGLIASCEPWHKQGARLIWICQALVRNEMYTRFIEIEQEEVILRRDTLSRYHERVILPLTQKWRVFGQIFRASPIQNVKLGVPTIYPFSAPPECASILLQQRRNEEERSQWKDVQDVRRVIAVLLKEFQLSHNASRARLEWEEELDRKKLYSQLRKFDAN